MIHLFVSPHSDDAALSCGGLIRRLSSAGERVVIATLFTQRPSTEARLPFTVRLWRAQCGVGTDVEAVREREDRAAAKQMGASVVFLRLPDAALRLSAAG